MDLPFQSLCRLVSYYVAFETTLFRFNNSANFQLLPTTTAVQHLLSRLNVPLPSQRLFYSPFRRLLSTVSASPLAGPVTSSPPLQQLFYYRFNSSCAVFYQIEDLTLDRFTKTRLFFPLLPVFFFRQIEALAVENRGFVVTEADAAAAVEEAGSASGPGGIRVTLVWMDPPATAASSVQLVHDLDLFLESPEGDLWTM